jgi:hypothetical protein
VERNQNKSSPAEDAYRRSKENLDFEAHQRGITPEEELRRRGNEKGFQVASDKLTRSKGIGSRILGSLKELVILPVDPDVQRPNLNI